ncbi:hypothetical protein GCM10009646_60310 [Streptomyces aureus]
MLRNSAAQSLCALTAHYGVTAAQVPGRYCAVDDRGRAAQSSPSRCAGGDGRLRNRCAEVSGGAVQRDAYRCTYRLAVTDCDRGALVWYAFGAPCRVNCPMDQRSTARVGMRIPDGRSEQ